MPRLFAVVESLSENFAEKKRSLDDENSPLLDVPTRGNDTSRRVYIFAANEASRFGNC
jgi:hypothetical protein